MISDDDFKVKWNGIVGTIIILAGLFIPSSDTVTAMVIAKNVTYEVVDETGKVLKNSVDYMFDKIKDFKNGQENLACNLARAIKLVFPVCFQVEGWKRDDNGRVNGVRIYFFDDNLEKEIEPYRQLKHNYV